MTELTPKKSYQKPRLNKLGKLTQLTAGGSGTMAEGFAMMMASMATMRFP